MSRIERFLAAGLSVLLLIVRGAAFFRYRFDSDEPQHLHVAWGWTQGLVQYRDVFDNHTPLFHLITAPWLALFGERADILFYMRALMIPIWIFVSAATWIIARRFYSTRVAVWSLLILHLFPTFFLKSIEYRTDNLWLGLWMAALLVLTAGELTSLRMFAAGLILGLSACVSLKTTLLVVTLLLAGATTWILGNKTRDWRDALRVTLPALIGVAIAPAILALLFMRLGAWPDLVYCNFTFNELVSKTRHHSPFLRLIYLPALFLMLYALRERASRMEFDRAARWRFFIFTFSLFFTLTLACWWILISARDALAVLPLYAMVMAFWIDEQPFRVPALTAWTLLCLFGLGHYSEWLKNDTREFTTMMDQVIGLTKPGEPLMDFKGETIFRRRPYYFIFEAIGRAEMRHGLIPDTIATDMIKARCHVAQADGRFWPRHAKQFLLEHFIDVGRLRVSGNIIPESGGFETAIPGRYVIIDQHGQASGTLDGVPYHGAVDLAPGMHHFTRATDERVAWLWAPAFEHGYSPFHLRDLDF